MATYKYDSAHDWFEQFWRGKIAEAQANSTDLYSIGMELARQLDADQIQDLFQTEMGQDNYFTPLSDLMKCKECDFEADEADFTPSDVVGERMCPSCGSQQCFMEA